MKLRLFAICSGVVLLLVALRFSTVSYQPTAKVPELDQNGCIDGKIPVVLELGPGDQLRSFGYHTSLAELKKSFDRVRQSKVPVPHELWRPVLIVADENIPEKRVTELSNLFADTPFAPIVRVKSYPYRGARTTTANPSLAASSAQTEKFGLIKSEAGLTFPPSAQIVEFFKYSDSWWAKVTIPEASFAEFKEAVLKKGNSAFGDDIPGGGWRPNWWNHTDPEFRRLTIGSHFIFSLETTATRQGGKYAICMACECH